MVRLLAGAWRTSPPNVDVTIEEFAAAIPLVVRTRTAGLIWWRLQKTSLAEMADRSALRDAFRYAALEAEFHRRQLLETVGNLRRAGIEPIAFKGWHLARSYRDSALRPYEDIDLIVRRQDEERAAEICQTDRELHLLVDFDHVELYEFDDANVDELFERSLTITCEDAVIRVLAPEDHLRAITIHALKHNISNAIWLCDIALCVESAGPAFDWERALGSRHPQRQWIGCVIALAHDLLDAEIPPALAAKLPAIPAWLPDSVLAAWERNALVGEDKRPFAVREFFENPAAVVRLVARRWPPPVEVALNRRVPLTDAPLWIRRCYEFAYLFAPRRLAAAASRAPLVFRTSDPRTESRATVGRRTDRSLSSGVFQDPARDHRI